MTVYYTRRGDSGSTGVMGRGRVSKGSPIAAAMGDVDELNSQIGVAITRITDERITRMLRVVQDKLFTLGSEISCSVEGGLKPKAKINEHDVKELEKEIDELGQGLPQQKKFVLPGGSDGGAQLHLARAVARRAERSIVSFESGSKVSINQNIKGYLNRLSSFLFVAALYLNKKEGIEEFNPTYA